VSSVFVEGSRRNRKHVGKPSEWGRTRVAGHPPHGVEKTTRHVRGDAIGGTADGIGVPERVRG